jgi:NhaA family Na+:H+ antiporter
MSRNVTKGKQDHPWVRRLKSIVKAESFGGSFLLGCTLVALALVNSGWKEAYENFWLQTVGIQIGSWQISKNVLLFVNDGLMTLFFFVVGLEIKRECVEGELKELRKAALPAFSALGGMVIPAAFYLLAVPEGPGARGWGIPMATDIAFVVGLLSLLGKRVPHGLKIWLLTLAIVDDIGAVLVIALFYTESISFIPLSLGGIGFLLVLLAQRAGVRSIGVYTLLGLAIWFAVLKSGVHPTVAGVLLGLLTPAHALYSDALEMKQKLKEFLKKLDGKDAHLSPSELSQLTMLSTESVSPLERLEHRLSPWNVYLVLPLFALANAGVYFGGGLGETTVMKGVMLGLLVGKPVGVFLFSFVSVKLGLAVLPRGISWQALAAASILTGVGFTMSIFIAGLALDDSLLAQGKLGTLLSSAVSAIVGMAVLAWVLGPKAEKKKLGIVKK